MAFYEQASSPRKRFRNEIQNLKGRERGKRKVCLLYCIAKFYFYSITFVLQFTRQLTTAIAGTLLVRLIKKICMYFLSFRSRLSFLARSFWESFNFSISFAEVVGRAGERNSGAWTTEEKFGDSRVQH